MTSLVFGGLLLGLAGLALFLAWALRNRFPVRTASFRCYRCQRLLGPTAATDQNGERFCSVSHLQDQARVGITKKEKITALVLWLAIVTMFGIAASCDETPRGSVIPSFHGRPTPRVVVR